MIKEIKQTIYEAFNGTQFSTREEAEDYEIEMSIHKAYYENPLKSYDSANIHWPVDYQSLKKWVIENDDLIKRIQRR